jgi:hypothetical protein
LQLCLRHKQTKLWSMPIWNPISEYQPWVSFSSMYHYTEGWMVLVRIKLLLNSLTITLDTVYVHIIGTERRAQTLFNICNIWTIWVMDGGRNLSSTEVNLSLLHSNSLKFKCKPLHSAYVYSVSLGRKLHFS